MTENKHYYFLKLKDNFFDQGTIRLLEKEKDGCSKLILYLNLCLLSLNHEGVLMLNETTPYDIASLSSMIGFSRKKVGEWVERLIALNLLERLEDGRYYVSDIELFVGRSSTEGERKRRKRMRLNGKVCES